MPISDAQQQRLLEIEPAAVPRPSRSPGSARSGRSRWQTPFGALVVGLSMAEVNATTCNLAVIFALVTVATVILAGVIATLVVRVALRPLGRVAGTATRVAELPLATGDVDPRRAGADDDTDPDTEVGQVGAALNRMLGHIENALVARQASEQKVRQFVADASHELRTPLASIRGLRRAHPPRGGETCRPTRSARSRASSPSRSA